MPDFAYNAIDAQGRTMRGALSAESAAAAFDQMVERGWAPVTLEETGAGKPGADAAASRGPGFLARKRRVSSAQVEAFTRELANLLAAGVPLGRALHILRREAAHPQARQQWTAIHDDVVGGKSLAEALARWPQSFPPVFIAMIRAGELGGFLDIVLQQIADFRARDAELLGKVKTALVYPCVLLVMAFLVMTFLLTFFIPKFTDIFHDFGQALPVLTQVIVALSHLVTRYGVVVAAALLALFLGLRRYLATHRGRLTLERITLRTPGLGLILARFALVRFARMLGTLLAAGVPLVTALRVAQEAIGNHTLSDAVAGAIDEVKRGTSLSRGLAACPMLFPPSVLEMVAVAEESGRLDKELIRLAQSHEGELDRRLRMLVALAEPILLFLIAALVGTIVVGMLLPIFTLQELIK